MDLAFTKDPSWIAQREATWAIVVRSFVADYTQRQREVLRRYFMTGVPPADRYSIPSNGYIHLFPLQTRAGLAYCFAHHFPVDDEVEFGLKYVWTEYTHICPDKDRATQTALFPVFFGDRFAPVRDFPFLLSGETGHRPLRIDAGEMLHIFIDHISQWLEYAEEDAEQPLAMDMLDYMFSIFAHVPAHKLSLVRPREPADSLHYTERDEITNTIRSCQRIHGFMRLIVRKKIAASDEAIRATKLAALEALHGRFDHLQPGTCPQTLIDHWQWVKAGKPLRFTPPPSP